jgi:hypothetical protein
MKKNKKRVLEELSGTKKDRRRKHLRSILSAELIKLFRPKNAHEFLSVSKSAVNLGNKVLALNDTSDKKLQELTNKDFFGPALYDATFLAGLSSLWEFELRILANKLGVNIYKTYEETSSKGRKAKFVEFNDLEDVIRELNRKTNNNLNLDLDTIRQIRNGLVHFNFNHTRKIFNIKRRTLPGKHKSSLVQIDLGTGDLERVSDIEELGKMLEKDIFAWFIDVWGTALPYDTQNLLLKSLEKIHFLTSFHAYSFDERKVIIEKIFIKGEKPSVEEVHLYVNYFEKMKLKVAPKEYMKMITDCFIKLA